MAQQSECVKDQVGCFVLCKKTSDSKAWPWSRDVAVDQPKLDAVNRARRDTRRFAFATSIHLFFALLAFTHCSTIINRRLRFDDDARSQSHALLLFSMRESQLARLTLYWRTVCGHRLAITAEDGHSTHPFYGCIGAAIGG